MAKINVGKDCIIKADFVLKNRILSQEQTVVFRTALATGSGSLLVEHAMQQDAAVNNRDGHVTLRYDLKELDVLPGNYAWELFLQETDGTRHCLLAAEDNVLCVLGAVVLNDGEVLV